MSKVVTSVTLFRDAVGMRLHVTYSELDENGAIVSDNKHVDRVITDKAILKNSDNLFSFAGTIV